MIDAQPRTMCCVGCAAVARAIVAAGHGDYYRYRERKADPASIESLPAFLRSTELYDDAALQARFVRPHDGLCEATLVLEDIRCAACVWLNERQLRATAGIVDVEVDYATHRARVRWDPEQIAFSSILDSLAALGYRATPFDPAHRDALERAEHSRSLDRLIFAGVLGMAVMHFSIAVYLFGHADESGTLPLWVRIGRWSSLIVTTALLAWPGREFFAGALRDLGNRRAGMDVPIVLGLSLAWIASTWSTWAGTGETYFDSIAMFVFLVLLARRRELAGRRMAAAGLDRLARVIPQTAERSTGEGWETVSTAALAPGDRLRIAEGSAVPVDARLLADAELDEAALTGEANPVFRAAGSVVAAGVLNTAAPLEVEVVHAERDSATARMQLLIDSANRWRPRAAQLADRVAGFFVLAIIAIALATAAFWGATDPVQAVPNTIAVLIVTCPCALALATPLALAMGIGRAAEAGLLPLDVDRTEALAKADTLLIDKTGTLTRGVPRIVDELALDGDRDRALSVAAALEAGAAHPFARAFAAAAGASRLAAVNQRVIPGQGVEADIAGQRWSIGRLDAAERDFSSAATERVGGWERLGHSVVVLRRGSDPVALYALNDPLRDDTVATLAALRAQGITHIELLSGDRASAVERVAANAGIIEWRAEQTPDDKLRRVRQLQAAGRRVWMVGDGINDAPTLAAADVAVSFQEATELARSHSHFVLLGDSLAGLARARALAVATARTIRGNLAWAIAYNLVAIPLAIAGWVPPWGAALGMSASSLIVVGNSLRLRAHGAAPPPQMPVATGEGQAGRPLDAAGAVPR